MTFLQSLILGIVQGLTEFLPISSSGHLVLVPFLLGWSIPESQIFPFDVLVQIGTLVAVIIYFWHDLITILKAFVRGLLIRKPFDDANARLGWYLILATIPAGLAGVFLKSRVEAAFNSPKMTAYFLFGTAALLLAAELLSRRNRRVLDIKWFDALWIGVFQALSIFPGISRSGSTITGGMTRNLDRSSAARFSFLMSIPVMLAAGGLSVLDLVKVPNLSSFLPVLAVGFVVAAVVGYLSIHWLLSFIRKRSLIYFAAYCLLLATAVLVIGNVRGETNQPVGGLTPASTEIPAVLSTGEPQGSASPTVVEYTASLDWMTPIMASCANTIPDTSIVTRLVPGSQSQPSEAALLFHWGAPSNLVDYSAQMDTNQLSLIVNPENPLSSLTPEMIQNIASGKTATWDAIYQECPDCFTNAPDPDLGNQAPGLNFYLTGEEAQNLFDTAIMAGAPIARASGTLVPSALRMRETVAGSTAAIGFLPSGAVDDSVKLITLDGVEGGSLSLPILAIDASEPQGSIRTWLVCIQQSLAN